MQVLDNVTVDLGALISWSTLPEAEREQLLETFAALGPEAPERWSERNVVRLNAPEPLFLLRAANGLRIIFRREADGRIVILDVVLQEMLDRYFADKPNGL